MPSKISTKDRKTLTKAIKDSIKESLTSEQVKMVLEVVTTSLDTVLTSKKSDVKKSKSAYMFFNMEQQQSADMKSVSSITERAKAIGAKWKTLSAETKKKYEKLAEADKKRYEKESAAEKDSA